MALGQKLGLAAEITLEVLHAGSKLKIIRLLGPR
jgi:hypothetical protein